MDVAALVAHPMGDRGAATGTADLSSADHPTTRGSIDGGTGNTAADTADASSADHPTMIGSSDVGSGETSVDTGDASSTDDTATGSDTGKDAGNYCLFGLGSVKC
jgi:hypothetical protein